MIAALPDDAPRRSPGGLANETLGMILFLVAEVMFFAGLVSAYIVLREGAPQWKPTGLPSLARGLSIAGTVLLCVSCLPMILAQRAARGGDRGGLKSFLIVVMLMGLTFVSLQLIEFRSLHALVPYSGNIFGSVFYTYVGLHAIHVLGGLIWLVVVIAAAFRGRYARGRSAGVTLFGMYWYFVVIVWVFLFFALYVL